MRMAWIGGDHSITLPLLRAYRAHLGRPDRLAAQGSPPLYVSLDIDCLDPAFAPGTGTPEPGGMSTNQVLSVLEGLQGFDCVGMDCVEVAPPYDHAELTSYAAAAFVWTYLCGRIAFERIQGHVLRDHAGLFKVFDAAQAGRRRQVHALCMTLRLNG